jgi:hypothetical protein
VTRALIDGIQVGFVVHHESESPLELLKRAAAVGISHGQTHTDKDIVFVNRYDWVHSRTHHTDPTPPGRRLTSPGSLLLLCVYV